jgi:hypothetical protein
MALPSETLGFVVGVGLTVAFSVVVVCFRTCYSRASGEGGAAISKRKIAYEVLSTPAASVHQAVSAVVVEMEASKKEAELFKKKQKKEASKHDE